MITGVTNGLTLTTDHLVAVISVNVYSVAVDDIDDG